MPIPFPHLLLNGRYPVSLAIPKPDHPFHPTAKKNICGSCGKTHRTFYDRKLRLVRDLSCGDTRIYLELEKRRVLCQRCGKVKQEKFGFLANNPFYTKRFAYYVGKRCSTATVKDVARELHLDRKTVNALEKQYMREKLRRTGNPGPRPLALTRSPSVRATAIESSSAIWRGGGPSGLEEPTVLRRA